MYSTYVQDPDQVKQSRFDGFEEMYSKLCGNVLICWLWCFSNSSPALLQCLKVRAFICKLVSLFDPSILCSLPAACAWHKQALYCCSWQQKYLDFILFFLLLYPEKVFNADPLLTLFVQNSDKFLTYKGHIPLGWKYNNTFWITLYSMYLVAC